MNAFSQEPETPTLGCSQPGHRVQVVIVRPRGRVAELTSLADKAVTRARRDGEGCP